MKERAVLPCGFSVAKCCGPAFAEIRWRRISTIESEPASAGSVVQLPPFRIRRAADGPLQTGRLLRNVHANAATDSFEREGAVECKQDLLEFLVTLSCVLGGDLVVLAGFFDSIVRLFPPVVRLLLLAGCDGDHHEFA